LIAAGRNSASRRVGIAPISVAIVLLAQSLSKYAKFFAGMLVIAALTQGCQSIGYGVGSVLEHIRIQRSGTIMHGEPDGQGGTKWTAERE